MALLFLSLAITGCLATFSSDPFARYHPLQSGIGDDNFVEGARPPKADPKLDCSIREYAYNYAKFLQPERGNFRSVFDALQLGPLCGLTPPTSGESPAEKWTRESKYGLKADQTIYVDAVNGKDTNSGTQASPLQTIQAGVALSRASAGTDTIILRAGSYYVDNLQLTSIDQGLTIKNYQGEQPVLTGGKSVNFNWKSYVNNTMRVFQNINAVYGRAANQGNVTGISYYGKTNAYTDCSSACQKDATCNAFTWHDADQGAYALECFFLVDNSFDMYPQSGHVSGQKLNIYVADLSGQAPANPDQLFINGKRQIRARQPNADPETQGIWTTSTGYFGSAKSWLEPKTYPAAVEIHISSPSFPTDLNQYFPAYQEGVGGPVSMFSPPLSFWGTKNPPGGGGSTFVVPSGLTFDPATFPNTNLSNPTDGVVHAYHCGYWGNWQFAVNGYTQSSSTLSWQTGGWQEARGCKTGSSWYVENILELLDSPSEWYFDYRTNLLYYYPNSTTLPTTGIFPQVQTLVAITGNKLFPARNITLSGLTFAHTRQQFMLPYEVPSGGDWSVHRGGAVIVEGTENVVIENNLFQAVGGTGLLVSNYNRGTLVSGNEFYLTGEGAIVNLGTAGLMDGETGNYPVGIHIVGNLAHDIGIWGKQVGAVYQSITVESLMEKNVFFNGPRAGININDGFGGGHLVQDNLLFNFVRETADHGPINSWDRQPYITSFNTGTPDIYPKQSQITRSFLFGGYGSAWPIDHDDGSAYYLDTHNVVIYGGSKNYLGHSKINRFNVYVNPEVSVWGGMRCMNEYTGAKEEEYSGNICASENSNGNIYNLASCSTTDFSQVPVTSNNSYYFPTGVAVTVTCGSSSLSLAQWQALGRDLGSTSNGPATADQIIGWIKAALNGP